MSENFVEVDNAHRLITPGPVLLVSAGTGSDDNLFSVAWSMALRKAPPMVAILSGKGHYSWNLMESTGEFGLNVPGADLAEAVIFCGRHSGREVPDKFAAAGLSRSPAREIKAPLVKEAVAHLECRICQVVDMGYSSLAMAQVVYAEAREVYFSGGSWDFSTGLRLIHHLGGDRFSVSSEDLQVRQPPYAHEAAD